MAIRTARLDLIPASIASLSAELRSARALEAELGIAVPADWPPELYDRPAIEYVLARLTEDGEPPEWWFHYFVRRATGGAPALVIGAGGLKGPPRAGEAEIGYSVLASHRRLGYASEAAAGLATRAFASPAVERVIAHTLPELLPSIGVLEKCGFQQLGGATEEGALRFALNRSRWLRWRSSSGVAGA